MGHSIRAIIGTLETVRQIESEWLLMQTAVLPQGYGMIFLTDALFDNLTELADPSAAPQRRGDCQSPAERAGRAQGSDEFDALQLAHHRRMPD